MAYGRIGVVFGAQAGLGGIIQYCQSSRKGMQLGMGSPTQVFNRSRLSDAEILAVLGQIKSFAEHLKRESFEIRWTVLGAAPHVELPLLAKVIGLEIEGAELAGLDELNHCDLDALIYIPLDVQQPKQVEHMAKLSMVQPRLRHVAVSTTPRWSHSQLMALRESFEWVDPKAASKLLNFAEDLIRLAGGITRKDLERMDLGPQHGSDDVVDPVILTRSSRMRELLALVDAVADTDSTILITGESGTGKELIAQRIHARCHRRAMPLVAVNCGAIPDELLESELFGHMKGAFTGAVSNREGRFEAAEGGTLFLDEIGEMGANLQVKLLRVLQTRKFEPVGSTKSRAANVRIVAATNRDLEAAVKDGSFREDLFYRLNVIPVHILGLKERPEDVGLLVEHFVRKFNRDKSRRVTGVTRAALRALVAYEWPGNVRELENLMERMVILKSSGMIDVLDFPEKYRRKTLSEIEYDDLINGARTIESTVAVQQMGQTWEESGEETMKMTPNTFIKHPISQGASQGESNGIGNGLEHASRSVADGGDIQISMAESISVEEAIRFFADRVVFPNEGLDFNSIVDQFENILILQALEKTGWNRNRAAGLLRLNRTTLVEKLKKKQLLPPMRYDNRPLEGNA